MNNNRLIYKRNEKWRIVGFAVLCRKESNLHDTTAEFNFAGHLKRHKSHLSCAANTMQITKYYCRNKTIQKHVVHFLSKD